MSTTLNYIKRKVTSIRFAILRCRNEQTNKSWQIKVDPADSENLQCVLDTDVAWEDVLNQNVNIVQKDKDNYLYITGRVTPKESGDRRTFSVSILKACWFIRKSRGHVSWLQEKYVYENFLSEDIEMEMAS